MVKGASVALGVIGMLADFGVSVKVTLHTDLAAATGIGSRRGMGKVRHIELNQLWLQEKVAVGAVRVFKISGADNFSDSLTKHSVVDRIRQTLKCANQDIVLGRHKLMPYTA